MTNLTTNKSAMVWDSEQVEIIKNQIAKGCSDAQLAMFSQVCQKTGLDPFSRQIYCIMRGGNPTIQVSIDGFRTIAARSGLYGGSMTEWCGEDGIWRDVWLSQKPPAAAKTTVWRKGSIQPFTGVARFGAYQQGNSMWQKMPDTMIAKVSESLALRKAFPAELSGLYTTEEMQQVDPAPVAVYSAEIQQSQEALADCMELLGWDKAKKGEWAKTICPRPFGQWTASEWKSAVAKAHTEIDMMNAIEAIEVENDT
jgi:phage recombination protein Bet